MKIKARPDDADMLEGDELFQMNGWLAELRDEGRDESRDHDRSGARENGHPRPRGDGHAGSEDGGRAGIQGAGHRGPWGNGHAGSGENGRAGLRDSGQAGSRSDGGAGLRDNGQAGSRSDGGPRPKAPGLAKPPWQGHPRPEAFAAVPVTTPVRRAPATVRAVIGDQLRLPIMWCDMASCISRFAHPAALGEADIRARAIDAGWRVDAVGQLVCPQCVQSAPSFKSPLPVVPWDREAAIAMSAQMAGEPSAEAVTSAAQELSHDLRCPAVSHPDEVSVPSTWIAAVPTEDAVATADVARSTSEETSDRVRHPADDYQPEDHSRPGRHRKRFAARLMFASH